MFVIPPFNETYKQADEKYSDMIKSGWGPTNFWLLASECMRTKGIWLAVCQGDEFHPIADYSAADDPGHALLLGINARIQDRPMNLADVVKLNLYYSHMIFSLKKVG